MGPRSRRSGDLLKARSEGDALDGGEGNGEWRDRLERLRSGALGHTGSPSWRRIGDEGAEDMVVDVNYVV